jgi:hypothetical protein
MILGALTLASVLTLATPLDAPDQPAVQHEPLRVSPNPLIRPPVAERTPNLYRPPGPECADIQRRVRQDQRLAFEKLGKLPPGHAEYAVLRQVQGCAVPAPVGYHPPALPGAADVPPPAPAAPPGK